MARAAQEILDRLGPGGLSRALDDLLDQGRLVRLANACGLEYRGMRTQSQSRVRLIRDLAEKARQQDDVGTAVVRALEKSAAPAAREWSRLDTSEKLRRLADEELLRADGHVGLHLYLLAHADDASAADARELELAGERLQRLASNGARPPATPPPAAKASREEGRLRRQVEERERKLRHLEAQIVKARESHKAIKQDLILRKGELAESRMLAERLRQELAYSRNAGQSTEPSEPQRSEKSLAELAAAVRQLTTEQRKLAHHLPAPGDPKPARAEAAALRSVLDAVKQLEKSIAADATERGRQLDAVAERLQALRAEVRARPQARPDKPVKRARAKGSAQRVGVFIDVQNVYYGARRLKGKLDFDALLEAAVQGRRHIKTTAYVVESKETDQSQFIAILEARGIEVRRKTLQVRADGSMKGDWDMELALDILDAAAGLDVVVLVSGDGDFTSLVKRVKSMGPRVEVMSFARNTAKSLAQAADDFRPLDRKLMIYARAEKADSDPAPASTGVPLSTARADAAPDPDPAGDPGSRGTTRDALGSG